MDFIMPDDFEIDDGFGDLEDDITVCNDASSQLSAEIQAAKEELFENLDYCGVVSDELVDMCLKLIGKLLDDEEYYVECREQIDLMKRCEECSYHENIRITYNKLLKIEKGNMDEVREWKEKLLAQLKGVSLLEKERGFTIPYIITGTIK